ncbi:MAG: hypothetical protein ACRDV4_06165 [Acidimicrobiales bacterium]
MSKEEVYIVLAGSGRVKLEDEVRELRQWDVVRVPAPVARGFESGPPRSSLRSQKRRRSRNYAPS